MENKKACRYIDKISGIVAPFSFKGSEIERFRGPIESQIKALAIPSDLKKQISSDIIMSELDLELGRISNLSVFTNVCLQYYMQRERAAIADLRTAIAIQRFSSPRDAEAQREVAALKERAHQILSDLGHLLINKKLMFQSTTRIIGEVKYALENNNGDLYSNLAIRTNELRNIAIIYFPEPLQEHLLHEINRLSEIPIETLSQCVRACETALPDYLDKEDYQFADPQNIIRNRHLKEAAVA